MQGLDCVVHTVSVQAEIQVTVVSRLPAKNRVHCPAAVDHRIDPGGPKQVQDSDRFCRGHLVVKPQRRTTVEVSDFSRKPHVSAVRPPREWADEDHRVHIQRTMQMRPGEPAWPLSVEPQFGTEAARVDGHREQVIYVREEQVGHHHRVFPTRQVDEALFD